MRDHDHASRGLGRDDPHDRVGTQREWSERRCDRLTVGDATLGDHPVGRRARGARVHAHQPAAALRVRAEMQPVAARRCEEFGDVQIRIGLRTVIEDPHVPVAVLVIDRLHLGQALILHVLDVLESGVRDQIRTMNVIHGSLLPIGFGYDEAPQPIRPAGPRKRCAAEVIRRRFSVRSGRSTRPRARP